MGPGGVEPPSFAYSIKNAGGEQINRYPMDPCNVLLDDS